MKKEIVIGICSHLPARWGRAAKPENEQVAYDAAMALELGLSEAQIFESLIPRISGVKTIALAATIYFVRSGIRRYAYYMSGGGGYANPRNPYYSPSYTPPEEGVYCRWSSLGDACVGDSGGAIHIDDLTDKPFGTPTAPGLWEMIRDAHRDILPIFAEFLGVDYQALYRQYFGFEA